MLRFERFLHVHPIAAVVVLVTLTGLFSGGCDAINVHSHTPLLAPVVGLPPHGVSDANLIPDEYLVVFKDDDIDDDTVLADITPFVITVLRRYDFPWYKGVLVKIPPQDLEHVQRIAGIAYLEANRFGERTGIQSCPPWNLDMLDQQSTTPMLDDWYASSYTGKNVHVVVVDTGVQGSDFRQLPNPHDYIKEVCTASDNDGHGTMVAEVVAGKTLGVAKDAKIIGYNMAARKACPYDQGTNTCPAVCNLPCGSSKPSIADTVDVLSDIAKAMTKDQMGNASLPGSVVVLFPYTYNSADPGWAANKGSLGSAVTGIVGKGGIFVTSAGHSNEDACNTLPAALSDDPSIGEQVITVGGMSENGIVNLLGFNTGPCVDVFAPGIDVRTKHPALPSLMDTSCAKEEVRSENGTSFAAAHVAGVVAVMLQENPNTVAFKSARFLPKATRSMALTGGLPGSPDLVVHNPHNEGESGVVDEDDAADKIKLCYGLDCPVCDLDGKNPCNPNGCSERVRCTGDACARCGREGDRCCSGNDKCVSPLACDNNGICACGGKDQACCQFNGASPCKDGYVCRLNNNMQETCVDCGGPNEPCCAQGACDSNNLQCLDGKCQTCDAKGSPCCVENGTPYCVGNDLQCISGQCDTCGKKDGVCCAHGGAPCVEKDVACINNTCKACGASGQACCVGNGQASCNGVDLQCVGGQCTSCGKSGATCCQSAIGPYCVDAGLSCVNNTCTGCGAEGGDCCIGAAGPYCAGVNLQCKAGKCAACGTTNLDCCAGSDGAYCLGAGTTCLNNICVKCGTDDGPGFDFCCVDNGQAYCYGNELQCYGGLCSDCGGINKPCCPDSSCRNELACVGGTCVGRCTARCVQGQVIHTSTEVTTADACRAWAGIQCGTWEFGPRARVHYNGDVVYNLDKNFPGNCGANNMYCCYTNDDLDNDGDKDSCIGDPKDYKCVRFEPPEHAIGWAHCTTCGGNDQPCCTEPPDHPECGLTYHCNANKCVPNP